MKEEELQELLLQEIRNRLDLLENKCHDQAYEIADLSEFKDTASKEIKVIKKLIRKSVDVSLKYFSLLAESYKEKFLVLTSSKQCTDGKIIQSRYFIGKFGEIKCDCIPFEYYNFLNGNTNDDNAIIIYRVFASEGEFVFTSSQLENMRIDAFDDADSARLFAEIVD